jgi:hypothetical protein
MDSNRGLKPGFLLIAAVADLAILVINSLKCHSRYRQIVYCLYERLIGLYNELPKDRREHSFCDSFLLLYKSCLTIPSGTENSLFSVPVC